MRIKTTPFLHLRQITGKSEGECDSWQPIIIHTEPFFQKRTMRPETGDGGRGGGEGGACQGKSELVQTTMTSGGHPDAKLT